MNELKLTMLVENSVRKRGLLAEHGLAFWIQIGNHNILFDAGQTDVLQHNAKKLGIDLSTADAVILSHGHYDHTGGLVGMLNNNFPKTLFVHPAAFEDKYAKNSDGTGRYIGMNPEIRSGLQKKTSIRQTLAPTEVCGGVFVTGPIPRLTDFEDTGGDFYKDAACSQVDDLIDDQAMYIETPVGIVVVLGCAHSGIINTLRYIRKLVPEKPMHSVIGGMHLVKANENRICGTVEALGEFGIRNLYPVHCTGIEAAVNLRNGFSGHVSSCPVGTELRFDD